MGLDAIARAGAYLDYATMMLERVEGGLAIGRAELDATVIARHLRAAGAATLHAGIGLGEGAG